MSSAEALQTAVVEQRSRVPQCAVTDELGGILRTVRDRCPSDARISFDFDGRLRLHLDVRTADQVSNVESALAGTRAGMFHSFTRGKTPHHPFYRGLSAVFDARSVPRGIRQSNASAAWSMRPCCARMLALRPYPKRKPGLTGLRRGGRPR